MRRGGPTRVQVAQEEHGEDTKHGKNGHLGDNVHGNDNGQDQDKGEDPPENTKRLAAAAALGALIVVLHSAEVLKATSTEDEEEADEGQGKRNRGPISAPLIL